MLEQAMQHHRQGEYEQAEKIYRELLENEPENFELMHLFGVMKLEQGDSDQALELVENAIDLRPNAAAFYLSLASILKHKGDYSGARANVETALDLNPNLPEAHNTLGYLQFVLGDLDEAEKTLNMALRLTPESAPVLTNLGNVILAQGRIADACNHLQEALERQPDSHAARASLGRAFMLQGAPGLAEECFRRCVEALPESTKLKFWLARSQLGSGLSEQARQTLGELVHQKPTDFDAAVTIALLAETENRLSDASRFYQQALQFRQADPAALESLGSVLFRLNEYPAAVQCLRSAKGRAGVSEKLPVNLALTLRALGQTEQALDELSGDGLPELLLKAQILIEENRITEAYGNLNKILNQDPDHIQALILKARLAMDTGNFENALKQLDAKNTQQFFATDAQFHAMRAYCLNGMSEYEQAASAFSSATQAANPPPPVLVQSKVTLEQAITSSKRQFDDQWTDPIYIVGLPDVGLQDLLPTLNQLSKLEVLTDRSQHAERNDFIAHQSELSPDKFDAAQIHLARRRYWHALRRNRQKENLPVLAVDWLPSDQFNPLLIANIFPKARIWVVARHPGDHLLHSGTQGWQAEAASNIIDLEEFYRPLFEIQDQLQMQISWLDFDQLISGDLTSLISAINDPAIILDQLPQQFATLAEKQAHNNGYWPKDHWRNYHHTLSLPTEEIEALAAQLNQRF